MFYRINTSKKVPLINAYMKNDINEFKKLIASGENVDCLSNLDRSLISLVIENSNNFNDKENRKFFKILCDSDVYLGSVGHDAPLIITSILNNSSVYYAKNLLKKNGLMMFYDEINNVKKTKTLFTAIDNAIGLQDMEKIKLLLPYYKMMKTKISNEEPMLHRVLHMHNVNNIIKIIKILNNYGLDFNERDYDGYTCLHITASFNKNKKLFNFLIKNKADINAKDNNNNTPLMKASLYGNHEAMKILIKNGANINQKNKDGKTALMIAAHSNINKTMGILLKSSSKTDIQDNEGNNFTYHFIKNLHVSNIESYEKLFKKNYKLFLSKNYEGISSFGIIQYRYPDFFKKMQSFIKKRENAIKN